MVDLSHLRLRLQTPRGELRAVVRHLERFRLAFEAEAPLRPGDTLDFTLSTSPDAPTTFEVIRGTLRVLRILDAHPGAPSFFGAELLRLHTGCEAELLALLQSLAEPLVFPTAPFTRSSEHPAALEIEDGTSGPTCPVAEGDIAMASLGTTVTSLSDPARRQHPGPGEDRLAGREAIRAALRRDLSSTEGGRRRPGATERGAWLIPTLTRTRRLLQQWGRPTADARPEADPRVQVDIVDGTPTIRVAWARAERFTADFESHLRGRGLFVTTNAVLPRHTQVRVELSPPHAPAIHCTGRVEVPMSTGLGLCLQLSDEQFSQLKAGIETSPPGTSGPLANSND